MAPQTAQITTTAGVCDIKTEAICFLSLAWGDTLSLVIASYLNMSLLVASGCSECEEKGIKEGKKIVCVSLHNYVKAETSSHTMMSRVPLFRTDNWWMGGCREMNGQEEEEGWPKKKPQRKTKERFERRERKENLAALLSISHPNLLP